MEEIEDIINAFEVEAKKDDKGSLEYNIIPSKLDFDHILTGIELPAINYRNLSIETIESIFWKIQTWWDMPEGTVFSVHCDDLSDEYLFAARDKLINCMYTYHKAVDFTNSNSETCLYDLEYDNEGHIQMNCMGYSSKIDDYVIVKAGKIEDLELFKEYVNLDEKNSNQVISFMKKLENIINWEQVNQDILNFSDTDKKQSVR